MSTDHKIAIALMVLCGGLAALSRLDAFKSVLDVPLFVTGLAYVLITPIVSWRIVRSGLPPVWLGYFAFGLWCLLLLFAATMTF